LFDALPPPLRASLQLIVSNPPYVAEHEVAALPEEVRSYEPRRALVAGPRGTEAIEVLLAGARPWLAPGGALVVELAPQQADDMQQHARDAGYAAVFVRDDLAGRARVLVARTG
jgi:release factor glutamine methyltransferase